MIIQLIIIIVLIVIGAIAMKFLSGIAKIIVKIAIVLLVIGAILSVLGYDFLGIQPTVGKAMNMVNESIQGITGKISEPLQEITDKIPENITNLLP